MITRAYPAIYLGGTPSHRTGTSPPSYLLLENRLFMFESTRNNVFTIKCSIGQVLKPGVHPYVKMPKSLLFKMA